jgi:uncharacterized protein (DUF697 family)
MTEPTTFGKTTKPSATMPGTTTASQMSQMSPTPSMNAQESLAALRTMICVAKADGKIEDRERDALVSCFADVSLPQGATLEGMLKETIDLDAQLALVTTPGAGERLYSSAWAVAYAGELPDHKLTPETRKALERIRDHFKISQERQKFHEKLWSETKDTLLPSNIAPITDAAKRTEAVDKDVLKYSVMSAVLGSFPVPGLAIATDLGVVALQVKLVRDIGQYWGHKMDRAAATSLLGGLGLGTGMRIAISNLAKFVPVWGSVVGGTASFGSTWGLGKVAVKYFESGMKADVGGLRADFKQAEKKGREAFAKQAPAIEAKRNETRERLDTMQADFESGKLSRADYEAKVGELA